MITNRIILQQKITHPSGIVTQHVKCGYCGNDWFETVFPEKDPKSCACNQGKAWKKI